MSEDARVNAGWLAATLMLSLAGLFLGTDVEAAQALGVLLIAGAIRILISVTSLAGRRSSR